ncbi:MAG: hypothetical protein ACP5NV_00545 [Candidatus Woesearchaeota archaeon]
MGYVFVSPNWFFVYSIILEIIFAIITLIVSFYAFKVYKLTDQRPAKLFSTAFVFIALSYTIQAMLNAIIWWKFDSQVVHMINLRDAALLNLFGLYAHALFFIIGLLILCYVTLKADSIKTLLLMVALVVGSIFFSTNKLFLFYVLSSIVLVFIILHYFVNYAKNRTPNTFLVLVAMIFLLFGTFHYLFAVEHEIYYVIGHVLEFIAYLLILTNLLVILKHGKKKR